MKTEKLRNGNKEANNLFIEWYRILLATCIVIFHIVSHKFNTTDHPHQKYYLFVDFFFVISGFVLYKVYQRDLYANNNIQSKIKFMVVRIKRIWPTALVAIALSMLLFLYEKIMQNINGTPLNIFPERNLKYLLYAIMLLQIISLKTFFIVPNIWSVSVEIITNLIYLFQKMVDRNYKIITLSLFGVLMLYFGGKYNLYLPIATFGTTGLPALGRAIIGFTLGYLAKKNELLINRYLNKYLITIITLTMITGFFYGFLPYQIDCYYMDAIFALILVYTNNYNLPSNSLSGKTGKFFGALTYPYFAYNVVMIDLVNYLLGKKEMIGINEDQSTNLQLLIEIIVVIIITLFISYLSENLLRKYISKKPTLNFRKTFLIKNNN